MAWKQSEVNLTVSEKAPVINFQVDLLANYDKLQECILEIVNDVDEIQKHSLVREKTKECVTSNGGSRENAVSVFHEMRALEQRRFLRHLSSFIEFFPSELQNYPHLIFLDVGNLKDNGNEEIAQHVNEDEIFEKFEWSLKFLCECEDGWHPTEFNFPLSSVSDVTNLILRTSAYMGRVFSLMQHSTNMTLPTIIAPKDEKWGPFCEKALEKIGKSLKFEESFENEYRQLIELAKSLDEHSTHGGLKLCRFSVGKELWLCEKHCSSSNFRMKVGTKSLGLVDADNELSIVDRHSSTLLAGSFDIPRKRLAKDSHPDELKGKTSRACLIQ